jgi:DNA helicase HerA-like ATPase
VNGWQRPKRVTLVCGASGTGKTTFALRYAERCDADLVFGFDPDLELSQRFGVAPCRTAFELELGTRRGLCMFDPAVIFPGDTPRAFGFWSEYVFEMGQRMPGRKLVFVDELQNYAPSSSIPRGLAQILETGRRRDMEAILLTNRPNAIHPVVWQQCTEVVAFNCPGHTARERLTEQGFDADEVAALPPLHWISRCVTGPGEMRGKLKF